MLCLYQQLYFKILNINLYIIQVMIFYICNNQNDFINPLKRLYIFKLNKLKFEFPKFMSKLPKKQQICSVCESQPQDILILSCRHNLCLDCSTQVYNIGAKQNKLVCQICLTQTNLDNDTITCLRSLSAKNIRSAYDHNENKSNYPPAPTKNIFQQNSSAKNSNLIDKNAELCLIEEQIIISPSIRCQKHNQPLTYYCMECNFYKICSQCMLMDNHRYHKVLTLKKAGYYIKQSIQKVGRQKMKLKNLLQKDKQNLIIRRQQSQKQLELNLNDLKSNFDELNRLIIKRYQQIKQKMQQQAFRKLQIMQGAVNEITEKIELIEETLQFQEQLLGAVFNNNINGGSRNNYSMGNGNSGNNIGSIFQMFQYYQTEMNQNKVNFQPSLPNYISQVQQLKLNKQKVFQQIQNLMNHLTFQTQPTDQNNQNSLNQQEIKYISHIDVNNLVHHQQDQRQLQKYSFNHNLNQHNKQQLFMRRKVLQDKLIQNKKASSNHNNQNQKRNVPSSQNINIIQFSHHKNHNSDGVNAAIASKNIMNDRKKDLAINNNYNMQQQKRSKQSIQAIKRKARQNLKDRELANSRKMELSRSIVNATDIINKIQQRTAKI